MIFSSSEVDSSALPLANTRRSLTLLDRAWALSSTRSSISFCASCSSPRNPWVMVRMIERMELSGERSSWEAFSRNQVLASSTRLRFSYTDAFVMDRLIRSPRVENREICS